MVYNGFFKSVILFFLGSFLDFSVIFIILSFIFFCSMLVWMVNFIINVGSVLEFFWMDSFMWFFWYLNNVLVMCEFLMEWLFGNMFLGSEGSLYMGVIIGNDWKMLWKMWNILVCLFFFLVEGWISENGGVGGGGGVGWEGVDGCVFMLEFGFFIIGFLELVMGDVYESESFSEGNSFGCLIWGFKFENSGDEIGNYLFI